MPREGHDQDIVIIAKISLISIHVPREGHDDKDVEISIHVPREGHDPLLMASIFPSLGFQSTCPARGTTANMHNFFVQICARVTNIPLKGMPYLQKTYVSI